VEGSDGNLYLISYTEQAGVNSATNGNNVVVMRVTENFAYVRQLYKDLLNRTNATLAEIQFWAGFIDAGVSTQADVANAILHSPAYRGDVVTNDYETFLFRAPTATELAFYTSEPALTAFSDADVAFAILTSQEYNNLYTNANAFVLSLYKNLLQNVDTAGLAVWVNDLTTASLTRSQVVTSFLGSAGVFNKALDSYYTDLLRRHPSQAEVQAWNNLFAPGVTNPVDVITSFLTSKEYLTNDVNPQGPT
jgi:hypothetical protein